MARVELDQLKIILQRHFTDGLVTIVGSGLSAAEGLPTMWTLEQHLQNSISPNISPELASQWEAIQIRLKTGKGLESALSEVPPGPELEERIVTLTAELVTERELAAVQSVISGERILPLTRLLKHMSVPRSGGINIVTYNYDRLIEIAAEMAGLGVDTMFYGHYHAKLDATLSKESFLAQLVEKKGTATKRYRKRVNLYKPHGSLDWFEFGGEPIRCPLPISSRRLIITPGNRKYRKGYDAVFESHRQRGNEAIDNASQYLIIGYGFNDDHLETHLRKELRKGKPCVILTWSLTENAATVVARHPKVIALTRIEFPNGQTGTKLTWEGLEQEFPGTSLWELESFVREVFGS
ncbi:MULTISPECIES: SIR2 family protein [Sorangium]|uniref:SIR2 family protein n=1 Tax=Sorangium TaxID=39643 RepID=UPI003D9C06B9